MPKNDFQTSWRTGNEFDPCDENDMYCPKVGGNKGSNNFRRSSCRIKQDSKDVPGCTKNCKAVASGSYSYSYTSSTPEDRAAVRKMILDGKSRHEIVAKLGVKMNLADRVKKDMKQKGLI
jgi:hypothetical protein